MTERRPLVIDTQHHWFGPRYRAAIAAEAAANPAFAGPNALFLSFDDHHPGARLDDRISLLDQTGVDVAVLSVAPPAAAFRDGAAAAAAIATANAEVIEACRQAPDRFVALALLPLPFVEESVAELDRLVQQPEVRGVLVGVDALGYAPDKLEMEPVLERVAAASYLFEVHPAGYDPGPNRAFEDYGLAPSLQMMVQTSVAGLRFVLSGLLDRYPQLDLAVPHLGGVIPYLTQRLVEQTAGRNQHPLTDYLTNRLYYDNCSFHPPALRCAIDTVGADRIMLGSDYPFRGPLGRMVEYVEAADLGARGEAAIFGKTAARWFAIDRQEVSA